MNTKCKCGGTLERHQRLISSEHNNPIVWKCPKCEHEVTQRKRTPYKLNATKDIRKIRTHLGVLIERNPVTVENKEEWQKFATKYLNLYIGLNATIEKVIITL